MSDNKISALFFDIDGTLVSFKTHQIPKSTIDAIARAKANGVEVYISTGRPRQIITNLRDIEHYIDGYITTNGALCIVGDNVVRCTPIPRGDVDALIADADKCDYTVLVVGEGGVRLYNPKPIFDEIFVKDLNVRNIDTSLDAQETLRNERILQLTPFFSMEHERELMPRLSGCTSGRWHPAFTDITSKDADKGQGLEAMAAWLGLDVSQTMAFGDGGNDVAILRRAGIGIAMGNAGDEAKAVADYVTTSVDEDGVMLALQHYGMIE